MDIPQAIALRAFHVTLDGLELTVTFQVHVHQLAKMETAPVKMVGFSTLILAFAFV